ncbi:16S rRNA (uracil(1498)-N(3))-methyltransferase [Acinetobacter guerrae]|uniref:Ribosomal RNA small subunit methyltransferase E n=1 Tax=Acinetobacter guerrae TaxID=1843371 RepID=A0A3A8EVS8_9GAMM|nr:16S rRNA (uracil(1498)-N(3))-methyltransferase [Acinetobacter guerrae]RKG34164.1 16S rRNA (uracil(1498)-N(3))-methyltransferase [Acinetobacter guerrae]
MNIVLLEPDDCQDALWIIQQPRQYQHIIQHLKLKVGEHLKVGIRNLARYLVEIKKIDHDKIWVEPIQKEFVPTKLPVTLIVALPRPKVLRRLVMDSVTLGVDKLILIHSYRVDKSYWQTPFLQQLDHYVTLGLEQAGDVYAPEIQLYQRFKPFVEDVLPQMIDIDKPAYLAHPYAEKPMPQAIGHACTVIIGPEGGFIPYEVDLMKKNGCQVYHLGNRILRTETAVSYLLGRLFA